MSLSITPKGVRKCIIHQFFFYQYETPNGVICGDGVIQYRDAVIRRLYMMVGLPCVWIFPNNYAL